MNVHGFTEDPELMTILLDDDNHKHPTHLNITEAFKSLSEQSQAGDAVFVLFSGHGGRVLDSAVDSEAESYDEVVVPSDYATSGLIRDTLMFKTLLAPMRYGVTVTIIIDSCDTGTMLDLPYSWSTRADRLETLAKVRSQQFCLICFVAIVRHSRIAHFSLTMQMSYNDDFSFVRFLKVVKTLYESSTFTQLGKTVGSALIVQPPTSSKFDATADDEDDTFRSSPQDEDEDYTHHEQHGKHAQSSLLNVLAACTSPVNSIENGSPGKTHGKVDNREIVTVDTRDTKTPSSLLEQVMNCTYGQAEDPYSDEERYSSGGERSFDETLEDSTFDSFTDDGYDESRRGRGRSRRRRQAH